MKSHLGVFLILRTLLLFVETKSSSSSFDDIFGSSSSTTSSSDSADAETDVFGVQVSRGTIRMPENDSGNYTEETLTAPEEAEKSIFDFLFGSNKETTILSMTPVLNPVVESNSDSSFKRNSDELVSGNLSVAGENTPASLSSTNGQPKISPTQSDSRNESRSESFGSIINSFFTNLTELLKPNAASVKNGSATVTGNTKFSTVVNTSPNVSPESSSSRNSSGTSNSLPNSAQSSNRASPSSFVVANQVNHQTENNPEDTPKYESIDSVCEVDPTKAVEGKLDSQLSVTLEEIQSSGSKNETMEVESPEDEIESVSSNDDEIESQSSNDDEIESESSNEDEIESQKHIRNIREPPPLDQYPTPILKRRNRKHVPKILPSTSTESEDSAASDATLMGTANDSDPESTEFKQLNKVHVAFNGCEDLKCKVELLKPSGLSKDDIESLPTESAKMLLHGSDLKVWFEANSFKVTTLQTLLEFQAFRYTKELRTKYLAVNKKHKEYMEAHGCFLLADGKKRYSAKYASKIVSDELENDLRERVSEQISEYCSENEGRKLDIGNVLFLLCVFWLYHWI